MAAADKRLRFGPIARDAVRAYASHWRLLVPLALIVLLPQAIADAYLGDLEVDRLHSAGDYLKLASVPATVAINLGGEALYAGLVAATVVHWRRGARLRDIRSVLTGLPLGRLIAADLVLAVGTAIGFVLLVVPGVLFFTYLVLTPALIELRRLKLGEALRLSVDLVRGNFWRVLIFALAVLAFTDLAGTALESPIAGAPGEAAINLAIEAVLEPFQALATVVLALGLIELHRDRVPHPANPAAGSSPG